MAHTGLKDADGWRLFWLSARGPLTEGCFEFADAGFELFDAVFEGRDAARRILRPCAQSQGWQRIGARWRAGTGNCRGSAR